ncbi:MAG: hypothetical protein EBS25_00865 [Actinobacteria bacterium]|nr:hypothetical protein [Actinomycetota bacterium]
MPSFNPTKKGKPVGERTAEIILGFFPEITSGARATHKYFAKFLTIVSLLGFLALLGINTLLAQDAFTLSNLKFEAKQVADARDAINRSIDSHAAPERLAAAASALGMRPSETPVFLDLTTPADTGVTHG